MGRRSDHELIEPSEHFVAIRAFSLVLAEEGEDVRHPIDRFVDGRIRAARIRSELDEILGVCVGSEPTPHLTLRCQMVGGRHFGREPTDRRQDVDGRKVSLVRELPREHHVTVENRPRRIRDRVVHIVALDQHGVETCDRSFLT